MSELFVTTGDALVRIVGRNAEVLVERPGLQCVVVDPRRPERIVAPAVRRQR